MNNIIQVENLSYDYPGKRALSGVSFAIPAASVTALVGPNGAGKTTLLRCLAALQPPYSGTVEVVGRDTAEYPREVHAQVGYLSDFFGLYEALSVEQCLWHAAAMHGLAAGKLKATAAQVLQRLGLEGYAKVKAGALSRGLRQRLAIAQAIVHQPRVVLLDEPASGLDPEARASLAELICELRDGGMTLIVSSHILSELEAYSTHMMIIKEGRMTAHRLLGDEHQPVRRLRLRFAALDDTLRQRLGGLPAMATPSFRGNEVSFDFGGGDAEQGALLSQLVGEGLPLLEFAVDRVSMERAYLQDAEVKHES